MENWEKQKNANILAFLTGPEYRERKMALEKLCAALETTKIEWGLSCSTSLFFNGICDEFNDLDILIKLDDVKEFETIFEKFGKIDHNTIQKPGFVSPYYKEGSVFNVHVDLVGDISLNTFNKRFCYKVSKDQINFITIEGDLTLPLIPTEANLLLYGMMEGWQARRRFKRKLCIDFLLKRGLRHPEILADALQNQDLPNFLKEYVIALLNKSEE